MRLGIVRTQPSEGAGQAGRCHEIPRRVYFEGCDIMDMSAITTFIQTLGFPIACVVYLFYAQSKEREAHEAESKAWTEALHNNTLAITKLSDIINERIGTNDK